MENSVDVPRYVCCKRLYQYAAVLTATLGALNIGMHYGWPSPMLPILLSNNSTIPTTSSDGSWIVIMPLIGLPFGCLIAAGIVDRIGRKICLLIGSPILLISWLVIAYAHNVTTLEIGRFLAGIGDGVINTVLPMYVGEVADTKSRAFLGCSIQFICKLGLLVINVIGVHYDMRTTALIACSVPIVHFVTFIWMPESPYFYILRKRNTNAASSLQKLTGIQNVSMEILKLEPTINENSNTSWKVLDIFKNRIDRRAVTVILVLKLVEQFSGFIAIEFYCLTIFNDAGGSVEGSTATIVYFGVQVVVSTLSGLVAEKAGRKPLLIISIIGSGFSLALEGAYFYCKNETSIDLSVFGFLPLTALVLYIISFSLGLATIPGLLLTEIFHTRSKAFAVCISTISFSVYATVVSKFFQIMKDGYGMYIPFFCFAVCCVFGLIFIVFCVPETKGKTLEEIQTDWENLLSKPRKNVTQR